MGLHHPNLRRWSVLCGCLGWVDIVIDKTFLAEIHNGMRISAHGVLGRIRDGRYYKELNFGCGEMLRHLEEMATRFYSGDVKAVDEFLQLYDLDEKRTKP